VLFPAHEIVGVPIVESGSRFSAPVRYGDRITVRATVAWVKDKTFRMDYDVRVAGTACAQGFEVRAWVARPRAAGETLHAKPIPADVVEKLRR
jgi:acyl-CoA thioesterase FadM